MLDTTVIKQLETNYSSSSLWVL